MIHLNAQNKANLILLALWVIFCVVFSLPFIFLSYLGMSLVFFSSIPMLMLIVSLLYLPILIIRLFEKEKRRRAVWMITAILIYYPIYASCIITGNMIHTAGVRQAKKNAKPLIEAIRQYDKDKGAPPDDIKQLIPKYIDKIPEPGMADAQFDLGRDGDGKGWHLKFFSNMGEINIYSSQINDWIPDNK